MLTSTLLLPSWPLLGLQVLQIACGGMHTVALTADHQIFSWGVNDEGALGRETGAPLLPPPPPSLSAQLGATAHTCMGARTGSEPRMQPAHLPAWPAPAAGELWEKSGQASGKAGDAYVPGKVPLPKEAGKVVQVTAGALGLGLSVCLSGWQGGISPGLLQISGAAGRQAAEEEPLPTRLGLQATATPVY